MISDGSQDHPLLHDVYQRASETLGYKATDCNGKDFIGEYRNAELSKESVKLSWKLICVIAKDHATLKKT